jgi:RNA polymerase sigma-70 factor (ECF subfamily)
MDRDSRLCDNTSEHSRREWLDEDRLIARARIRDPAALAMLFARFHDSAVGFAYLQLRNRDDAEDAVQAAWARALRAIDQFRGTGQFSTWLFTIVLNECRAFHKRFRNWQNTSLEAAMDSGQWSSLKAAVAPAEMGLDYERQQMQRRLRQHIERLPVIYRRVLLLRYVVGLPLGKVASLLRISKPAAKSRVMRARTELQAIFLRDMDLRKVPNRPSGSAVTPHKPKAS